MSLQYNNATPPRKLYNKLRVSDSVILARNVTYPNSVDDSPIVGDDGTVKFLAIDSDPVPVSGKDYDPDFFTITKTEGPQTGWQTSVPSDLPVYKITYTPTKLSVDQIKANAANKELAIRNSLANPAETTADLYILAGALSRANLNLTLSPTEQAALDNANKLGSVLGENRQVLAEKHAAIEAGQEPDLTAGYSTELPS